jgi:hypothetical protein
MFGAGNLLLVAAAWIAGRYLYEGASCRTYEPARRLTLSGPPTSLVVDEDRELEGGPE